VLALVLISVLGTGTVAWLYYQQQSPTTAIVTETIQSNELIDSDRDFLIEVGATSGDQVFSQVYNNVINSQQLVSHSFTSNGSPATAGEVITLLNLRLSGSFARSLQNLTIGGVDGSAPYLIMRSTDFDTGFAGMLNWEQSMNVDLAALFGEPVTQTFDPDARTVDRLRTPFFQDDIIANTSVRILRDEEGNKHILYGFADPSTIIITSEAYAFERLMSSVKK